MSLSKRFTEKTDEGYRKCRVTFRLSNVQAKAHNAESVSLVGEFCKWDKDKGIEMTVRKDGSFSCSHTFLTKARYEFKYCINNGEAWENDDAADCYVANDQGGDNSVLDLENCDVADENK
ncbi:MAG: isoamylase early set domain-containing protein [bacterium]|nr:isoamylase early set domain-containing protein [bacterium]